MGNVFPLLQCMLLILLACAKSEVLTHFISYLLNNIGNFEYLCLCAMHLGLYLLSPLPSDSHTQKLHSWCILKWVIFWDSILVPVITNQSFVVKHIWFCTQTFWSSQPQKKHDTNCYQQKSGKKFTDTYLSIYLSIDKFENTSSMQFTIQVIGIIFSPTYWGFMNDDFDLSKSAPHCTWLSRFLSKPSRTIWISLLSV